MRKSLLLLVFGWFFAVQTPASTPGVNATTIVGPFKTQMACEAEYAEMEDMLKALGIDAKVKKCFEEVDA